MANLHRFQISRAERGVKRSEKAAGRRRGNGGYGFAAGHGAVTGNELVSGRGGSLGLAAEKAVVAVTPPASADRALARKFLVAILALAAIAAAVAIVAMTAA